MTDLEFRACINGLVKQCPVAPSDEEVDARMTELWEDLEHVHVERLQAGVKCLIRVPDFKFFPSVGQVLEAIERAASPFRYASHHDKKMEKFYEPLYREEMRRMEEEGARLEADPASQDVVFSEVAGPSPKSQPSGMSRNFPELPWKTDLLPGGHKRLTAIQAQSAKPVTRGGKRSKKTT